MAYCVYILYNKVIDKYYIGYTNNIENRLTDHRKGKTRSQYTSKQKGEWKLVYYEEYKSRIEAVRREREIKNKKSRKYIESLLERNPLKKEESMRS